MDTLGQWFSTGCHFAAWQALWEDLEASLDVTLGTGSGACLVKARHVKHPVTAKNDLVQNVNNAGVKNPAIRPNKKLSLELAGGVVVKALDSHMADHGSHPRQGVCVGVCVPKIPKGEWRRRDCSMTISPG